MAATVASGDPILSILYGAYPYNKFKTDMSDEVWLMSFDDEWRSTPSFEANPDPDERLAT